MELGVPRIPVERRLRRRQRLVQLVACGEAPGQAVQRARVVALDGEGVLEFLLGILEQTNSPQCVSVVRERLSVFRGAARQQLAIGVRM